MTITRHNKCNVTFFDDTILTLVTATPSLVDDWIVEIESFHRKKLDRLIVGLDCEWRACFSKPFVNYPVATLQLCVGRRCLIFQILHAQYIPHSLKNFLNNNNYTFTGVKIGDDVAKLWRDYSIKVARTADLRWLADDVYGEQELCCAGLKTLCRRVLGKEMEKPKKVTLSRWDKPWLTERQVIYACHDAFVSFEIGRVLIHGD
ncbi:3'-5' exonuclease-like [Rutidosis leptorrhynchoides]|uniref:3'-5' exonuclease-like n=1 Tax=Rutidosis leptorrhynchoides TaxID=125765 RepID=UPI003A99B4B6